MPLRAPKPAHNAGSVRSVNQKPGPPRMIRLAPSPTPTNAPLLARGATSEVTCTTRTIESRVKKRVIVPPVVTYKPVSVTPSAFPFTVSPLSSVTMTDARPKRCRLVQSAVSGDDLGASGGGMQQLPVSTTAVQRTATERRYNTLTGKGIGTSFSSW